MKSYQWALLIVGILLFLGGLIFALQGYGVVGPNTGFMYQNKTWIYAGSVILVVGVLLASAAVYTSRRTLNQTPTGGALSPSGQQSAYSQV